MTTNIPHNLTMPALSSLNGNLYRIRKITHKPSDVSVATSGQVRTININSPPNMFLLGTHSTVDWTAKLAVNSINPNGADVAAPGVAATFLNTDPLRDSQRRYRMKFGPGYPFSRIRESFNSNSYCVDQMDDPDSIGPIMRARALCSRRSAYSSDSYIDPYAVVATGGGPGIPATNYMLFKNPKKLNPGSLNISTLEQAGCVDGDQRSYINPATIAAAANDFRGLAYSVPLSAYSRLGTKQFVPTGLMGSYSSSAWSLQFVIANTDVAVALPEGTKNLAVNNGLEIHNLRINASYLEILDESVMDAIMRLYMKSETLSVGPGREIPLRLEIPFISYTYGSHLLPANTTQTTFKINTNSPSVRGILLCEGNADLTQDGDYSSTVFRWRYIKVKVGGHCIMECGYSLDDNKSAPQIQSDFYTEYNNASHMFSLFSPDEEALRGESPLSFCHFMTNNINLVSANRAPKFICLNLENAPHHALSESEVATARGVDLRNTGVLEVEVRYEKAVTSTDFPGSNNQLTSSIPIYSVLAHDKIVSVDRSGISDITQSSL